MIPENTPIVEKTYTTYTDNRSLLPSLCWGAIIGGTVAAIALHILLTTLGMGAGLATFSSGTGTHSATTFSETTAGIWSACALVAIFFGAAIAGRFSHSIHGGFVHGILVWSLTLIITFFLLSKGTSVLVGGGLKILGEGIGIGGNMAASDINTAAQSGVKRAGDEINSFVDEATQSIPTNSTPKANIRAKREVGLAVAKLFAPGNDINSSENQATVVKTLQDYTQMSQADAQSTVNDWVASYKDLQAQLDDTKAYAEQKAKAAAHDLSVASTWTFFGLLLGLIVSAGGGVLGADYAVKHMKVKIVSTTSTR
jgi:hypothetical protein